MPRSTAERDRALAFGSWPITRCCAPSAGRGRSRMRPRYRFVAAYGPVVVAHQHALAPRRRHRRHRRRHFREPRLRRRQGRSYPERHCGIEGRARRRRQCRRLPHRVGRACRPASHQPRGGARRRRRHRHARRCCFSTSSRRANASRPIPGSPTPPCSSSIRASCRSASRSARPSRSGKRTGRSPSLPMTAPCSSPMWRLA